tara:strand:+ start:174 stop:365 length:192 start_codon:yes stop_codon:yes gene_type:complete
MSNYNTFLKTNLSSYIGKWIALTEDGVIAVGEGAKETYEKAKQTAPRKKITLFKVPENEAMIF